jgi:hypothetical protein
MNGIRISVALIGLPAILWSQQLPDTRTKEIEELRKELILLRAQIDSMKMVQQLPAANDELESLALRLDRRFQELEKKVDAVARSTAPVVFNPRTTAFLNVAARRDDKLTLNEEGTVDITNRPYLRSVELDVRAPVDPYADAVAILAFEDEAGQGFHVEPEEAYGLIKRLPILETAPLGLKLRVGKYRAPLGVNNRLHMHDLPWTTRPLVVSKLFGTEQGDFFESGYAPVGVDVDFFLPNPIPGSTLEMNLDVVRAGELRVANGHDGGRVAGIARLNLSADWNNEHLFIVGASGYREKGESATTLYGFDVTYKWSPSENRAARSFVAGGEWYVAKHEVDDLHVGGSVIKPSGWFAYGQLQLSYWWYLGVRYDWANEPNDDQIATKALSAYLSYYTTEFLRLRTGVEHRWSNLPGFERLTSFNVEANFVFGSHPIEPYWVNR